MTAFIDTSTLVKRYISEEGSDKFTIVLEELSSVVVSPLTLTELFSGFMRRYNDKSISSQQFKVIEKEINKNAADFSIVQWSEELEMVCIQMIKKYNLRALDSVQLASAVMSSCQRFITSDKKLFEAAKKEIKTVQLI